MNNVFVYLEIEGTTVADVSLELLTKGRKLANQLGCQLEAVAAGSNLAGIEKQVLPFGVDKLHVFDAPGLFPYTSLPHSSVLINLFKEEQPQIHPPPRKCNTLSFPTFLIKSSNSFI
jgi:electron transfer flavoprotein alpha subunit